MLRFLSQAWHDNLGQRLLQACVPFNSPHTTAFGYTVDKEWYLAKELLTELAFAVLISQPRTSSLGATHRQ